MDVRSVEARLEAGEKLKIKYRYPCETGGDKCCPRQGVRSDKLLDVSTELERFYTNFRGETPIWLEAKEVIEIVPDDEVYEELPAE